MYRRFFLPAVMLLALLTSGCNDTQASSTKTESKAATASASDSATSGGTISDDRKNEDFDALVEEFTPLLDTYYQGIREQDYDMFLSAFPDFYKEQVEQECKEQSMDHKAYMNGMYTNLTDQYGADFKITYTFSQIFQLTDDSLTAYDDILKTKFGVTASVSDGYSAVVKEATSGMKDSSSYDLEWFFLKIDGKLYLYENYYES